MHLVTSTALVALILAGWDKIASYPVLYYEKSNITAVNFNKSVAEVDI